GSQGPGRKRDSRNCSKSRLPHVGMSTNKVHVTFVTRHGIRPRREAHSYLPTLQPSCPVPMLEPIPAGERNPMNLHDFDGRVQRLDQLSRGLAKEILIWKPCNDPLLYRERQD